VSEVEAVARRLARGMEFATIEAVDPPRIAQLLNYRMI
jgi:hypothetical protein